MSRASPSCGRTHVVLTAAFEVAAGIVPVVLRRPKVREVELGSRGQNPHLLGGATEAQAGEVTHPRSPSQEDEKQEFEPRTFSPQTCNLYSRGSQAWRAASHLPCVTSLSLCPQAEQQSPDDRVQSDRRAPMLTKAHIFPGKTGPHLCGRKNSISKCHALV